jgi:flagellar biosynthesis/type III secretory pathway chaperone
MNQVSQNSTETRPELLGLLSRQLGIYDQLRSLAEKQRALIASDDTRPLLEVLARRQSLTQELSQLGKRMAPLRDDWPQVRLSLPPEQQAAADALIDRANEQLKAILEGDEHDAQLLQVRKQRVAAALESTQSNKRAVAAYRAGGRAATSCFDLTNEES